MAGRLTADFKRQAANFMLETAKEIISSNFDKNDKTDKTIRVDNDLYSVSVYRSCFNSDDASKPYFEDYRVNFIAIMQNIKIGSMFYLEWQNNDMNTELIPGNTTWDLETGKCSQRIIEIKKCKR
jgi:hypothetical protein